MCYSTSTFRVVAIAHQNQVEPCMLQEGLSTPSNEPK